jgi:hypothetical protein
MGMRQLAILALLGILGLACSDGASPTSCVDVPVSVSSGTTPQFSWTLACPAYSLLVLDQETSMWYIGGGERMEDVIRSPVRYGIVPGGAVIPSGPAQPLQAGVTYTVMLDRRNWFGGGLSPLARRTFTP